MMLSESAMTLEDTLLSECAMTLPDEDTLLSGSAMTLTNEDALQRKENNRK